MPGNPNRAVAISETARRFRLATWNVNSLGARIERVEEWLEYAQPDVLCLQETKMSDESFPALEFASLGYEAVHHGNGQWNGVAILSRVGLGDVRKAFTGENPDTVAECRIIAATCQGIRVFSVYVPNGRSVGSEHYQAKLAWMSRLRHEISGAFKPDGLVAVCGDFNIAPDDRDVWDPLHFEGSTHVTESERAALNELLDWGFVDVFRSHHSDGDLFTWWDYRGGGFHRHHGMRIDLVLATQELARSSTFALVDRNARKGQRPSDHAPVLVDFELT